jgi:Cu2+-containing amine oxidase
MTTWKTDRSGLSASTQYANGSTESRLLSAIPVTDTILPADPLTPAEIAAAAKIVQDAADIAEARLYAKLTTLSGMTPTQVRNWVTANVTNLAQAQDAIATLAIAVGILWRDKQ